MELLVKGALLQKLHELVASAANEIYLVSPFITGDGLKPIEDALSDDTNVQIHVYFRGRDQDVIQGVLDCGALGRFANRSSVSCWACHDLHAKAYVVDGKHVILGSANLTGAAELSNLEMGFYLEDPEVAKSVIKSLEELDCSAVQGDEFKKKHDRYTCIRGSDRFHRYNNLFRGMARGLGFSARKTEYKSIIPLGKLSSGTAANYHLLFKLLEFVDTKKPWSTPLDDWIEEQTACNINQRARIVSFLENSLRVIQRPKGRYRLTEFGAQVRLDGCDVLSALLLARYWGFERVLRWFNSNPVGTCLDVRRELIEDYPRWRDHHNYLVRMMWLKSLGLLAMDAGDDKPLRDQVFCITPEGREWLEQIDAGLGAHASAIELWIKKA